MIRIFGRPRTKRIEYFDVIAQLFEFKEIYDPKGTEYVVYKNSHIDELNGDISDKTAFEALENHIHLLYDLRDDECEKLEPIARSLGQALLCVLKCRYPQKQFYVHVTFHRHDSLIIRFHQKWEGEEPYFNPEDFTSPDGRVFSFET